MLFFFRKLNNIPYIFLPNIFLEVVYVTFFGDSYRYLFSVNNCVMYDKENVRRSAKYVRVLSLGDRSDNL